LKAPSLIYKIQKGGKKDLTNVRKKHFHNCGRPLMLTPRMIDISSVSRQWTFSEDGYFFCHSPSQNIMLHYVRLKVFC